MSKLQSQKAKERWADPIKRKKWRESLCGKVMPRMAIITYRNCVRCGKAMEITPSKNREGHYKRFCSKKCMKNRINLKCYICEKEIERTPSKIKASKNGRFYCSRKCRGMGKRNKRNVKCLICGKELFLPLSRGKKVYCSKRCANKGKITGRFRKCNQCGNEYWSFKSAEERGAKYCSHKCCSDAKRSIGFLDSTVMRHNFGKQWSQKVKKRDSHTCQHCGSKEKIVAHHKRFEISNGITLCRDCHLKIHGQKDRQKY